jgi:hypothetical protein
MGIFKYLYKMATKKRTSTKRKRSTRKRTMSEGSKKRRTTRKRRSRSSKVGLSEAFSPAAATHTGKGMITGAAVGFGVRSLEPLIQEWGLPKWAESGLLLGGSFVSGTVLKMDGVSTAMAAIFGYKLAEDLKGLHEDGDWADQDSLNDDDPEYMDEAGNPMFLADDGNLYYLNEEDDDMMDEDDDDDNMSEQFLASNMYPSYVNR